VTLLPGDRLSLDIITKKSLQMEALIAPPMLQCVNRFGHAF
jgi:hypothetical protein